MNTSQNTQKFIIKPRLLTFPDEIHTFGITASLADVDAGKGAMLVESYSGDVVSGYLVMMSVYSRSDENKKQAVLFLKLIYSDIEEGRMLIREGLMRSWELDYHVAFARETDPLFVESGFRKVPGNFVRSDVTELPLLFSELSWHGMNELSADLIIPKVTNSQLN